MRGLLYRIVEDVSPLVKDINQDQTFWEMVEKADHTLDYDAQRAISSWVGGGPDKENNLNGIGFGIMHPDKMENLFKPDAKPHERLLLEEIQKAFKPLKDYLARHYGDNLVLHRGYGQHVIGEIEHKQVYSMSCDPRIAEYFAGVHQYGRKDPKVLTDQEISALVHQYNTTGETTAFGVTYRPSVDYPNSPYPDMFDRYGNHITDCESVLAQITDDNNEQKERLAKRNALKKRVKTLTVHIDNIIWVTDRFNQKEFIAYAGPTSELKQPTFEGIEPFPSKPREAVLKCIKSFRASPKMINNGWCWGFALALQKRLGPEAEVVSTTQIKGVFPGHWVVLYQGKYYDAESPDGVEDPKELAYSKRIYSLP